MTLVYIASACETDYPRKLQKPSTISDRIRDPADSFIMDSGIGNEDMTNADVLDLAHEYDADYVIAKDYLHDQERTTDSIKDFVAHYREHPCDATPMIPLQPPHYRHYRALSSDAGLYDHYVLGGMAGEEVSTQQAVRWTKQAARRIHNGAYIHALGVGGGINYAREIAPLGILDSLDCSTPEQAAMFGSRLDTQLRQEKCMAHSGGEGKSKRVKALAEFNSWQVQDVWDNLRESDTVQKTFETA